MQPLLLIALIMSNQSHFQYTTSRHVDHTFNSTWPPCLKGQTGNRLKLLERYIAPIALNYYLKQITIILIIVN